MNVLKWMTHMTDREIRDDLDQALASVPEHEHEVIKDYRRARMLAPDWKPAKQGNNNHKQVTPEVLRKARAHDRLCIVCSGPLPHGSTSRRTTCSSACRVRFHRGVSLQGMESPSDPNSVTIKPAKHAGSSGAKYEVRDLGNYWIYAGDPSSYTVVPRAEAPRTPGRYDCPHRADHGSCLRCYRKTSQ